MSEACAYMSLCNFEIKRSGYERKESSKGVNYPAASCGALKIKTELLLLLVPYIPTDDLGGHFVPNGPYKISVIP